MEFIEGSPVPKISGRDELIQAINQMLNASRANKMFTWAGLQRFNTSSAKQSDEPPVDT